MLIEQKHQRDKETWCSCKQVSFLKSTDACLCHEPVVALLQLLILSARAGKKTKQQAARKPGFIS